jgi:hypothetical protein
MLLRFPSLALGFVPVLARRLGVFVVATVNRKFWPKLKSGLGAFPPAQHSPFAASGRGFKHFACATAFPANPSNPALNPTALTGVGLAPRWASINAAWQLKPNESKMSPISRRIK